MVKIIADSCCDLSSELIKHFDIEIIPLNVLVNNQNYLDGVELSPEKLFEAVKTSGELPKTSAPSIAAFTQIFEKYPEFIYISISSKLSASFQSATIALDSLSNVKGEIIDSRNLSTGIGLLVVKAAELAQKGYSFEDIASAIKNLIPKVNASFVIDTLDYLYMGGRCSSMEHIFGSILKIRPVIEVRQDGTLGVREKISGSRKKGLSALLDNFSKNKDSIDPSRVFITHTVCLDDALFLKSEIEKMLEVKEICITDAGATIASHCGPNTIGILFLTK
ncbi:MAG: fatty acid-binding protein DegV [Chloroflexi bacterium HGW-Chloroflexi-4]|jgi:DegV family protein with EDD domain|nr:MAG: fatty acid-binding protein DegV [Chloroflexi bacterium HGW-Chloroflexi-4]